MSDNRGFKRSYSQKLHNPIFAPVSDNLKGSYVLPSTESKSSLVRGENGRRKFDPVYSSSEEFKPSCRIIDRQLYSDDIELKGKRLIQREAYCQKEIELPNKRHLLEASQRRSETTKYPSVIWETRKQVYMPDGAHASHRDPNEFQIETLMNRKQRILSDIEQRNYIPTATLGDKSYAQADREPGFYAKGGLIVGSTIVLKKSGKPSFKKNESMSGSSKNIKQLTAIPYEKKQERLSLQYDVSQVNFLTKPSSRQGQVVPSWEERTGMYLVNPEDENY